MRAIKYIVYHCTGGAQTQTLESIQKHWRDVMKWNRPGYHHLIMPNGTVHNLQPIEQPTNGVAGYNANSIHIAYVGGIDSRSRIADNRTDAQKLAMKNLAATYAQRFPAAQHVGHRDFSPDKNRDGIISSNEWIKACPSFSVKTWLVEQGIMSTVPQPKVMKAVKTLGASLNIRSGPSVSHRIIGSVPNGAALILLEVGSQFSLVQANDKLNGWVSNQFIG
jgi:N-acetylmuramoyl-L-alanine amidase